jgi:hypothetical protein
VTDDEEKLLKQELLMADINLRRKQDFWETPRNVAVLLAAMAAIFAAVFGVLGYKIGSTPSQPTVIIQFPPSLAPQLGAPTIIGPSK